MFLAQAGGRSRGVILRAGHGALASTNSASKSKSRWFAPTGSIFCKARCGPCPSGFPISRDHSGVISRPQLVALEAVLDHGFVLPLADEHRAGLDHYTSPLGPKARTTVPLRRRR